MPSRNFSESEVFKLAPPANRQGDAAFALVAEQCVWLVIDMQEAELMVLRKGFARVLPAAEIIRLLQAG